MNESPLKGLLNKAFDKRFSEEFELSNELYRNFLTSES